MKSCTLKMTLRRVAILFVLFVMSFQQVQSQSNEERAKAYYFQAEEAFTKKEYDKAINYCDQVVEILGSSNALVEVLYVKSYYAQNKIAKAKEALHSFSNFSPDASLSKEIAPYIVKIEEAEKEQLRREALAEKKAAEKAEYDRTHTTCRRCRGTGEAGFEKDCGKCNEGRIDCSKTCSMCKGKRRSYHGSAVGYVNCGFCKGSGKTKLTCPCNDCDGFGNVWDTKTCPECNGKGDVLKSW